MMKHGRKTKLIKFVELEHQDKELSSKKTFSKRKHLGWIPK